MWVPRFAYSNNDNSLIYIKQENAVFGDYRTSKMFISEADKWDYSYAGVWYEYEPAESNTALENKVKNLNKGESDEIYGFLANTKAYTALELGQNYYAQVYIYLLNKKTMDYPYYDNNEFNDVLLNTNIIKDANNNKRTILRVTETNKLEPIKATSYYDATTEKIIIEVTHNKNEIKEVLFQGKEKLEFTTINGKTISNTGEREIDTARYTATIIDVKGNAYIFTVYGVPVYATLYADGTLGLSTEKTTISGKAVSVSYGDIQLNTNLRPWYNNLSSIKTVNFVNKIRPITIGSWFYNCANLTAINNISNLDTSKVTNMYGMFQQCNSLTSLDLSKWDTSNVTNMSFMFSECKALRTLNIGNFNTSNVTNMYGMFQQCNSLTSLDLSKWNTSNVTNMGWMFSVCSALKTLNIGNFDTSNVTNMYCMFQQCNSLTSLDLSKWNTSNVTNMSFMFSVCSALKTLNLTNFNTSNVTDMSYMFQSCASLTSLNLKSFNTAKVTDMSSMFRNCTNLATIYVSKSTWIVPSKKTNMFSNCKTSSVTKQ